MYAFYTHIQKIRPHSSIEKLDIVTVLEKELNVPKVDNWKEGKPCIYFANGGVINPDYLKRNNLYRNVRLNLIPTDDIFTIKNFEPDGKVKTTDVYSKFSDGFIMPIGSLHKILGLKSIANLKDGQAIDIIDEVILAQKYNEKEI